MPRRIESLFIPGPEGRLEALLEEPEDRDPIEAALVCHPHPLYGGTMHNKVVYRIARALRARGCVVLRFNFRGVNLSEGEHAGGPGEVEDARCALGLLRERYPELPYSLAGFSFGSRVALRLGCKLPEPKPVRVIAAGFPTSEPAMYINNCGLPKYFVHSTEDVHGRRPELERMFADFAEPKSLRFIVAKDHFFAGALDEFEAAIREV